MNYKLRTKNRQLTLRDVCPGDVFQFTQCGFVNTPILRTNRPLGSEGAGVYLDAGSSNMLSCVRDATVRVINGAFVEE
jgi:hypothetical protein